MNRKQNREDQMYICAERIVLHVNFKLPVLKQHDQIVLRQRQHLQPIPRNCKTDMTLVTKRIDLPLKTKKFSQNFVVLSGADLGCLRGVAGGKSWVLFLQSVAP
jgi:hypothetical protein